LVTANTILFMIPGPSASKKPKVEKKKQNTNRFEK
jgi:hypothetical protein